MSSRLPTPAADSPLSHSRSSNSVSAKTAWLARWLDGWIFFWLCLLAILLPHSIKGSQHSWQIACISWFLSLAVLRKRPFPQPLSAPLLAYVTFSGISSALSPDAYLSWDRMKIVCLVMVGIVVAQNLRRLRQVRTLVALLILSGVAAVAFTAWQYTYGVGVMLASVQGTSPLYRAHVYQDDIIDRINGHKVRTPQQAVQIVQQTAPGSLIELDLLRGYPFHPKQTYITREGLIQSGLGTPALPMKRGHPRKAQGTLGHYVDFAVMLMQIGCLAFAVLLAVDPRRKGLRVCLGIAFVALTGSLFLTETRAALGGLAIGGMVSVVMLANRRSRLWATLALLFLLGAAALWIHHTRGATALSTADPGTQFRAMMWQDGFRLIHEHPWFGVGMESIRNHWMEWNIRAFKAFHDESHFHNDFIQIAVERGLPAAAAWLWFVVAYAIFLVRLILRALPRSRFAAGVATGILASFVALQLTSMVHYNLGIESVGMTVFFYFGLAVALDRILQDPQAIDVL
jgi:hypothetical protein